MSIDTVIKNRLNEISHDMRLLRDAVHAHHELAIRYSELENLLTKIDKPKFNLTMHRAMWGLLSEQPTLSKKEVLNILGATYIPECECFACEYLTKVAQENGENPMFNNTKSLCKLYCPFKLSSYIAESRDTFHIPSCLNGLYDRWVCSQSAGRAMYAKQIRDLEVREGVECI